MVQTGLQQDLGDGLVMRAARPDDTDRLVRFNSEMHAGPDRNGPSPSIAAWTRDLMTRPHPGLTLNEILVVEEPASGRIVSSTVYFDQKWAYAGIELPVGRPELVSTHPDFRNRGLIRRQFEVINRWGAERGHLVQGITGIPYYYRQFGYDLALEDTPQRSAPLSAVPQRKEGEEARTVLTDATEEDTSLILKMYRASQSRSLFSAQVRDEEIDHLLFRITPIEEFSRHPLLICDANDRRLGFAWVGLSYRRKTAMILAIEYIDIGMWRPNIASFITELGAWVRSKTTPNRPVDVVMFLLPANHPAQPLLGGEFASGDRPYAWYVRVPDMPALLRQLAPALSARLKGTAHEGLTQEVLISWYRSGIVLKFADGVLADVASVSWPRREDAAVRFPDLTFYQMLFGRRSFAELHDMYVDCAARSRADADLMDVLFPKKPSDLTFALQ
ncbi:MAG: GNAT family N-acetyltransferase [Chloroflexi bacterium]|nr:GNAT family N-acetyltransferase [Chloroflexota bacterium]